MRILKVARTGYFVTRLFKCPTLLKPALYTVVQFKKKFFTNFKKNFSKEFPKFYPFFRKCDAMNFKQLFSKFENCKINIIFSKLDNIQLFYNKNL